MTEKQKRHRQERKHWQHEQYLLRRSPEFDESMDETLQERQIDQYQLEIMTPQGRQEIWKQEQLKYLEGDSASRPDRIPIDDFEQYTIFKAEQLINDET